MHEANSSISWADLDLWTIVCDSWVHKIFSVPSFGRLGYTNWIL